MEIYQKRLIKMIENIVQKMKHILDDMSYEFRPYMSKDAYFNARGQVNHLIFQCQDYHAMQKDLDNFPDFVENIFALYQKGKYNKNTGRMI